MYEDKTLVCKDCGKEFTFSAGEQEFYAEKGFENEPQRCKECRQARKNKFMRQNKEMYEIVWHLYGKVDKVPFEPETTSLYIAVNVSQNKTTNTVQDPYE